MKVPPKLLLFPLLLIIFVINTSFINLRNDTISFTGFFGDAQLIQNKNYFCTAQNDSLSISTCRFYISGLTLYEGEVPVAKHDFQLIDLFDSTSRSFRLPFYSHGNITEIRFNLGIDSTTNVAGVGSGDLDPTKGMYWSWQSGYINMKMEGASRLCAKSRGEFQYHIGGYATPNNALQTVSLTINNDHGDFSIKVDVQQFLRNADLVRMPNVMSPSVKAVELSVHATEMFSLPQ